MSNIEQPATGPGGLSESYLITSQNTESDDGDDDTDLDLNEFGDIFGNIGGFTDNIDPKKNPLLWVQTQISRNVNPRLILQDLVPNIVVPDSVNDFSVWRLIFEIITEPSPRQRLTNVSTLKSVINLIRDCKNILVLTGAGVSVSCGIPDFRSRNGIYARLHEEYPDLPDPQAMFDIHYFRSNPCPFFRFAKAIYPGRFTPSISHYFISKLEKSGKLLRNYTQNIDTLEQVAGINNVVTCHGSFSNATCMNCKIKVPASDIEEVVFSQQIPYCKQCTPPEGTLNILKPDIVFFGEGLPEEFHRTIEKDKVNADLLIVIGSSLKVRPVALIPSFLKPEIPQILINREPLPHMQFDVELYGNCDDIIVELCRNLGDEWTDFSKSFSQTSLDFEKYKALIENIPDQDSSNQLLPIEKLTANTKENNSFGQSSYDQSNQQGPSCDTKIDNKRSLDHESSGCKKRKLSSETNKETRESDFYMFYPPNRYIFHGAELDCPDYSDDEVDDNDDEQNCSTDNYSENNCLSIDQCKVSISLPKTFNLSASNDCSRVGSESLSEKTSHDNLSKDLSKSDEELHKLHGNIGNSNVAEVSS